MDMLTKYKVPFLSFFSFALISVIVWMFRDIRYLFLFLGIGTCEFVVRTLIIKYPQYRQQFRLMVQSMVGGFLLLYLSLVIGVNFQYSQIIFDTTEGVVTGALIQTIVARVLLPFILGNAFCSRACWTGLFFEVTNNKSCKKPYKRNNYVALIYMGLVSIVMFFICYKYVNPATDESIRRIFIIGENIYIISVGFILTFLLGSRAYCRLLCPFLTISGFISPLSYFKIRVTDKDSCTNCKMCNKACPMLIDVNAYVIKNNPINHRQCILCERCVSSCSQNVLKVDSKRQKK